MKKIIIYFFVFSISFLMQSQTLTGDYQGYLYQNYYVGKYEKGRYVLIDSLQIDDKGTFTKQLDPDLYTPNTKYVIASEGEYKKNNNIANPHPHSSIRFVYMGEDISYQTSWRQETGYLKFIKGGAPTNHIKDLGIELDKTQNLFHYMEQLLLLLEENDPLYKQVMSSYTNKAKTFNALCQNIASNYAKDSYMNLYALMFQQVVPQKGMNFERFQNYKAKHLFQFTNLQNPLVANVPLLPIIYRSYLYQNQPTGMAMQEEIQKMQDQAKSYIKKNAAPEILEVLHLKDFRPQVQLLREKLTKTLNFDRLYKDDEGWFTEIDEILGAYNEHSPFHHLFGKDIITALERTQKPEAYTKLAVTAFSITEQFKWGDAESEIITYLTENKDERLLKGSGKVTQIYKKKY